MDFAELSKKSRVKLDIPPYEERNCLEITDTSIRDVPDRLFSSYKDKRFITIEINRTIIFLDRYSHPNTSYFDVWGRKYRTGKDSVFLNRVVNLGRVETEQWGESMIFFALMPSLLRSWIDLVQKDRDTNYVW